MVLVAPEPQAWREFRSGKGAARISLHTTAKAIYAEAMRGRTSLPPRRHPHSAKSALAARPILISGKIFFEM
jgi:hypothetical protein